MKLSIHDLGAMSTVMIMMVTHTDPTELIRTFLTCHMWASAVFLDSRLSPGTLLRPHLFPHVAPELIICF